LPPERFRTGIAKSGTMTAAAAAIVLASAVALRGRYQLPIETGASSYSRITALSVTLSAGARPLVSRSSGM